MAEPSRPRRPARKRVDQYHHGDLRRALLEEAVRVIQVRGVEALTLRAAGERLGVSRTALYRHFADKSALLAAVSREGFRTFRLALLDAWNTAPGTLAGLDAMGVAYVRFAMANPSYYRVMFGGFVDGGTKEAVGEDTGDAFQVLVDALISLQQRGLVRQEEPLQLARFVWAVVHGVAMLALDGLLRVEDFGGDAFVRYANDRVRTGIATVAGKSRK